VSLGGKIEEAIRWEIEARRIPSISYALVGRDGVIASGHLARSGRPAPTDASLFRIGSLTKMITATAAVQLIGQGRLGLDRDIGDVLPVSRGVTLRQLLSHTSGLIREAGAGHYLDHSARPLDETVRSLAALPRKVAAGTYRYSNAGYALVGAAVQAAGGVPYADYVRDHVFTPLGMDETRVGFDDPSRLAPALLWTFAGDTPAPLFNLGGAPAGNIVSTLGDMARFAQALLRGDLLSRESLETMWAVSGEHGYGLGFAVDRLDGRRTVGHGGVVYGYASSLTALPDDGLAVLLFGTMDMTNQVLSRLGAYGLRLALAERAPGAEPVPPIRTTPVIGRELAGDYWRPDGSDRIELRERDDGLFLLEGGVPLDVRAIGSDLVIDGRMQGQATDGTFLPVEFVPEGIRFRGELWTAEPPPFTDPPADLAPHLGTYGPDFLPTHLTYRDGKLRCLIEGLCPHVCDPVGDNRYIMRGPLYEDEILETGVLKSGGPALRVGDSVLERLG
jgi:D-alanyl-D-alanine dipeptidase